MGKAQIGNQETPLNWKMYDRDSNITFLEDEEGDGEESGGGGGDETPNDEESSDVDKLRASYDSTISELRKELKDIREQAEKTDSQGQFSQAYNSALNEVNAIINSAKSETDKGKALESVISALPALGQKYAQANYGYVQNSSMLRSAHAERFAILLQNEQGGDVSSYRAKFLSATSEDAMRAMFLEAQIENGKGKKGKGQKDQTQNSPPPIDRGRGNAARKNLLEEMKDIDLSTPEGQQKWREKEPQFRRELAKSGTP